MAEAHTAPLAFEQKGDVGFVRLARPAKRNALSDDLIRSLQARFEQLPESVKAVVLHSEGPHFCAGLDLAEMRERSTTEGVFHSMMWHASFQAIQFGRVPVVVGQAE